MTLPRSYLRNRGLNNCFSLVLLQVHIRGWISWVVQVPDHCLPKILNFANYPAYDIFIPPFLLHYNHCTRDCWGISNTITRGFYKRHFFTTQLRCFLTFTWMELQILLRCCLIHIIISVLRNILYLVYSCPCLGLVQFVLYFCDLYFFFILMFIIMNYITSLKQEHLFLVYFLEYHFIFLNDSLDEESE